MAEEEKKRRAASSQQDDLLQQALAASRAEEARRKQELERQRRAQAQAAHSAQAQAAHNRARSGGAMSEEEQLRRAMEASRLEEEQRKRNAAAGDSALQMAIEASKKTAKEEADRRAQEEKELNFALQLSAALYQANKVSRECVVQGEVQKEYAVPVREGELEVTVSRAKSLPVIQSGVKPYVVFRLLAVAPVGILTLTLHKGKQLRNIQMLGVQDPYAMIVMDRKKKGTSKVHYDSGRNPVWEQKFDIELTGREKDNSVEIQIWNKNMMNDERIGYAYLDVAAILTPTSKKWLRVNRKRGKSWSDLDGKICVSWSFRQRGTPAFKQIKVTESKKATIAGANPKWNQILTFPRNMSNIYIQATVRNSRTFAEDTIIAKSNVISVQGAIHHNFFSHGKNTWYGLMPTNATRGKCQDGKAGEIELIIKFRTEDMPGGITPIEVEPSDLGAAPQLEGGGVPVVVSVSPESKVSHGTVVQGAVVQGAVVQGAVVQGSMVAEQVVGSIMEPKRRVI